MTRRKSKPATRTMVPPMLPPRWAPDFSQPYHAEGEHPGVAFPIIEGQPLVQRWLEYVHRQPCIYANALFQCLGRIEGHHYGPRGMAQKASDFMMVPLCTGHHREWDTRGAVHPFPRRECELDFYRWQAVHLAQFLETIDGQ